MAKQHEHRTYHETEKTARGIEPVWPTEYWFCTNSKCGEPSDSDPCQFCGEPVERYLVVPRRPPPRRRRGRR